MLVCYKWYVYDIFVSSLNHVEKLKVYLLSKHSDIQFLLEKENDGRFFFISKFFIDKEKFVTNIYPKRRLAVYILISTASYPKYRI